MKKRDMRGDDSNWVEGAVFKNGGIESSAKILGVTKKLLVEWMKQGTLPIPLAQEVGKKLKCNWILLAYGRDADQMDWEILQKVYGFA